MIINWLKKPYFFISSVKFNLAFILGFFIFIFLWLFRPFGMHQVENNPFYYSLGFGLVTFFTIIYVFIVIPEIFKNLFKNENWTVGKNILFILFLVLHISFFNWVYNNKVQVTTKETTLISLSEMITFTFQLAIFPTLIFTYLSEKYYSDKRKKTSKEIMKFKVNNVTKLKNKEIVLKGNNNNENINFKLNDLIYISSEGNYINIYLNLNNGVEKFLLRTTLTKTLSALKNNKNIIKCHKSYIVNTNYVTSISGNARGYFLKSDNISIQIPVSRSFKKEDLLQFIN